MTRLREQYRLAIRDALGRWAATPGIWGRDDCALALADIDRAVQGVDPAEPYRGRYTTERGARRVLGKAGLMGAWGRAARRLGWPRIAPERARDGDRGIAVTAMGPTSVIRYAGRWAARVDHGNLFVTDAAVRRAWKVC
jgi:hypothetical protein